MTVNKTVNFIGDRKLDLENFVNMTLSQIALGVTAAQENTEETGAIVNPVI